MKVRVNLIQTVVASFPAVPGLKIIFFQFRENILIRFGYCGDGPGYCREVEEEKTEVNNNNVTSGCFFDPGYLLVGGDLDPGAGGGGISLGHDQDVSIHEC